MGLVLDQNQLFHSPSYQTLPLLVSDGVPHTVRVVHGEYTGDGDPQHRSFRVVIEEETFEVSEQTGSLRSGTECSIRATTSEE